MISIAVCTRARPGPLSRLLRSLCRLRVPDGLDWEIVVVDNNADPAGTAAVLEGLPRAVPARLLHEPAAGLSRARNRALASIGPHRHILWTDDDATIPPGWLSVYERAFRYWPEFDFFGGPVRARFEGGGPEWAGAALNLMPETFAHIDPTREFLELDAEAGFVPFGANMAFRAGVLKDLRFDETLGRQPGLVRRGGEEIDVFQRLMDRGSRGLWLPPAGLSHWIDPARQTPRQVYGHGLADAFAEELRDAGADLDSAAAALAPGDLEASYRLRAEELEPGRAAPESWLSALRQAGREDGRRLAWRCVPGHYRCARKKSGRRVLMVGLDGFEISLAERLMAQGELPNFRALREGCARFELDHGDALLTGLAWEHFSAGRSPADYGRYSAVDFDVETYTARQRGTRERTFVDGLDAHVLVFDVPYFDLAGTARVSGLTSWGAHDPGTPRRAKPATLDGEITARFGDYPARQWIYGFAWPDAGGAAEMGERLQAAVRRRSEICCWLFGERFRTWDVGMMVVSEFHSAVEGLWHGVDEGHPLHAAPSTAPAREGLLGVYRAADEMLGRLREALPDTDLVLYSPHGMGRNRSDVATMLLLPELMFRAAFGRPAYRPREGWRVDGAPERMLSPGEDWSRAVLPQLTLPEACAGEGSRADPGNLAFMPAAHYQPAWPLMDAFALPSFYDGRIRVNLQGRERRGRVPAGGYRACCERIAGMLHECRDARTGEPVVQAVKRYGGRDPLALDVSDCTLAVHWRSGSLCIEHPQHGRIGPAPLRRPGGHGGPGCAWIMSPRFAPGHHGRRSSFDVVPTLLQMLGEPWRGRVSGAPLEAG